jgi:hypothetical protein
VTREIEVFDSIEERIAADGLDALTEPERFYRAIYLLEAEVSNGGLHQYLWNAPDDQPFEALAALRSIGAGEMARILDEAISLFPERRIPTTHAERKRALDAIPESREAELTNRFYGYPDDVAQLLARYVQQHDAEFRGPRTLLDMWHSKRKRGVSAAPQFITREFDIESEAKRDRPYSSRSCPECGYPSPDYRVVCKKCGFPHGKHRPAVGL